MSLEFWGIMHDGTIEAISGRVPGDVVLTIGIEYICNCLPTAGDTLAATLRGCRLFNYTPYGGNTVTDLQEIAGHEIDILSAVPEADSFLVHCANGSLRVTYETVEVRTVEGILVSRAKLEAAANRSVSEWFQENRGGRADV